MNNMSLSKRFFILAVATAVILVIELSLIFINNTRISHISNQLEQVDVPLLDISHKVKLSVVQVQQWLTDISATRGQDGLNDGFDQAKKNAEIFHQLIKELKMLDTKNREMTGAELFRDAGGVAFLEEMEKRFNTYYDTGKGMAQSYIDNGPEGGNKVMESFDAAASAISSDVDKLLKLATVIAKKSMHEQVTHAKTSSINVAVSSALLVIILVLLFLLAGRVFKVLPHISSAIEVIAGGDLSQPHFVCKDKNELGQLADGLNRMKDNLRGILGQVSSTSQELFTAVEQLTVVSQMTEQGMEQQLNEINMVATAMNEMAATAQEVANSASSTANAAEDANHEAKDGKVVIDKTMSMISALAHDVEQSAEIIHEVENNTASIGTILDVIRGIAEQTNLLALNAAIEAARAGEQGRGFAVVADEVRTLASRTQQSTQEIDEMIARLQSSTNNAVKSMEAGRSRAAETVTQVAGAGTKLDAITRSVVSITDLSSHIASAATEQSSVAEDINRNISIINDATGQTTENARGISATSTQLAALATDMSAVVSKFTI